MRFKYLILTLALAMPVVAGPITLVPSASGLNVGDPLTLTIQATSLTDLYAYQFSLTFNPAVLSAVTTAAGTFLPSAASLFMPAQIDNTAGTLTFLSETLIGGVPGISGNGPLATVSFVALAPGTSAIEFSNVLLLNSSLGEVTSNWNNTSVSVTDVPEPSVLVLLLAGFTCLATGRLMFGKR